MPKMADAPRAVGPPLVSQAMQSASLSGIMGWTEILTRGEEGLELQFYWAILEPTPWDSCVIVPLLEIDLETIPSLGANKQIKDSVGSLLQGNMHMWLRVSLLAFPSSLISMRIGSPSQSLPLIITPKHKITMMEAPLEVAPLTEIGASDFLFVGGKHAQHCSR